MNIEVLSGIAPRLYELVAPLVMSCSVLRQNNNYPFKTSKHYLWFVAMERDMVIGFIPVEIKSTCVIINNYYVKGEDNAGIGIPDRCCFGTFQKYFGCPGRCPYPA